MKWIGLTGGIASGKSSVARLLRQRGYQVIDADRLAHEAIRSGQPAHLEIVRRFGELILSSDGEIDRAALGRVVFSDPSARADLERIIHPRVKESTKSLREQCQKNGERVAFYEVPLLLEKNMDKDFDAIWVVDVPENLQMNRLQSRSGLNAIEAEKRIRAQVPRAERQKRATVLIDNSGTLEQLALEVERLVSSLSIQ